MKMIWNRSRTVHETKQTLKRLQLLLLSCKINNLTQSLAPVIVTELSKANQVVNFCTEVGINIEHSSSYHLACL